MSGQLVNEDDEWMWRREGHADVRISHNRWTGTPANKDLPRLVPALKRLDDLIATARSALVEKYYELWNESWRQPYEPTLTAQEFSERFVFESIGYPDGQYLHESFSLNFDDDGLFAGHAFFVKFNLDGKQHDIEMFG